jgi:DNA segregation ATPase FtsK/SpoIIIE-like protein
MRITSSRAFQFLPEELFDMLRRRLRELGGLAVVALAILLLVALATWSVQDPSLNHATDARVQNWLGMPGAIAADFLMQLFGLAALALILPIGVLGWQILTHREVYRLRFRFIALLLGLVLSAGCAASIPATMNWPLPAGLGGVLGARRRAGGFRRARRDHQRPPRPGGHALRTGARARHQVVARHRPRRRHRPLDERDLGRVAVVPGRNAIGIELPNPGARRSICANCWPPRISSAKRKLPLCLGKTIGGEPVIVDLARMPHLLSPAPPARASRSRSTP